VLLVTALTTSCIRQPAGALPAEKLAVLRLENLSGDAALGWQGRALSEVISATLSARM